MATVQRIGVRKDKGILPILVFAAVGFIMGVGIVFVVAIHDVMAGGSFRHYELQYYWMAGLFGTLASLLFCSMLAWAFHGFEEEIDGEE